MTVCTNPEVGHDPFPSDVVSPPAFFWLEITGKCRLGNVRERPLADIVADMPGARQITHRRR